MVTFGAAEWGHVGGGLMHAGLLQGQQQAREVVPSGFRRLDGLLPAGGVRRGSLLEWLAGDDAAGAATLAFAVACKLAAIRSSLKTVVVVDRSGWFHPPAVMPWLGQTRLAVARPSRDDDEIWAIDQALRCPGVAAVLAWPRTVAARPQWSGERMPQPSRRQPALHQWTIAMRRWQLAARSSGAVGLFVRPESACREPSWSEARIAVSSLPGGTLLERRLRLTLAGGAWSGGDPGAERSAEVAIDLVRGDEAAVRAERPPAIAGRCRAPGVFAGGASCRAS